MAMKLEHDLKRACLGFPLHKQVKEQDPVICAKLYWPIGTVAWYIAGYDSKTYVAYGFATGCGEDGWGYFSVLAIIETLIAGVFPVKMDKDFVFTRASALGLPCQEISQ